jgi:hypothetical protein
VIVAEILSLISRLRAPSRHEVAGRQAWQGEESGMSGANKGGAFGVSLLSFNRFLPATTAICPCPSRSQA